MAFDIDYVPNLIDLVIADPKFKQYGWTSELVETLKKVLSPRGIGIKAREIEEKDIRRLSKGYVPEGIAPLTRDSVVIMHGDMNHEFQGVYAAIDLCERVDSRVIVEYDAQYHLSKVFEIAMNAGTMFAIRPIFQLGFYNENELLDVPLGEGSMGDYFRILAGLRQPNVNPTA